jgi:hypothetical protein
MVVFIYLFICSQAEKECSMALVSTGFWGSISVMDNGGQVSVLQYQLTSIDAVTALADIATIRARLEAIIDGEVIRQVYSERFDEASIVFPAAGIEIQNKASLTASLVGRVQKANLKVPTPIIGIFTAPTGGGANVVNLTNAALVAYFSSFQTGGEALISDGEVADALLAGKRIHAKSNLG